MAKRYIYTRPDGGVAVVTPADEIASAFATPASLSAHIVARSIPADALNMTPTDSAKIPTDRTYRAAWRQSLSAAVVDMTEARKLQMARIREVRDAELVKTDADFLKAQETNDVPGQNTLKSRRQELRDIPANIQGSVDAAADPAALKLVWPVSLPKRGGAG